MQYMVLNVDALKIESIWELLRAAASAAGLNSYLYDEIIETINAMKKASEWRSLTVYQAWTMVVGLCNRQQVVSPVLTGFMTSLKKIRAIDYLLVPTVRVSDDLLFQAESRFNWDQLLRSRAIENRIDNGIENATHFLKHCNDNAEFMFEINTNGKSSKYNIKVPKKPFVRSNNFRQETCR